jgi:hypothetical protein
VKLIVIYICDGAVRIMTWPQAGRYGLRVPAGSTVSIHELSERHVDPPRFLFSVHKGVFPWGKTRGV